MNYENEQALVDAGFVLTPEVFHSGKGNGKVYGKSFDNVAPFDDKNVEGGKHYDFYSVDPDGMVAVFQSNAGVMETPAEPVNTASPDGVVPETNPTE